MDDNGVTPLDFAIFRENYQTADMIREFGGKHNKLKMKKDPQRRDTAERSIADDMSTKQENTKQNGTSKGGDGIRNRLKKFFRCVY